MNRSIARRLAAMFAITALGVFVGVGAALHYILGRELARHQSDELHTRSTVVGQLIGKSASAAKWPATRARLDALTPLDGSVRFWVVSGDPRFRYGTPLDDPRMMALSAAIPPNSERPEVLFTVALDTTPFTDTQRTFALAIVVLVAAGVVVVAAFGYRIARIGLGPLRRLSDEAHAISPSNLSSRLDVAVLPRELSDLALSFNGVLDRVQRAYTQLEGFNADVAHELRTPVTNLIGQTQVALSKRRSAAELEEVLQSNLEELDRLRSIVGDMLFLARADQGETARERVAASAAQEIVRTVEFLEVFIEDAGIQVRVEGDARAAIETSLFRRAISNLLINAVEHSDHGAEVNVQVSRDEVGVRIAVTNPGDPIPAGHLERLFDRFHRVDGARVNRTGNHGLGLAIVKAIANMHGGAVFASSQGGRNTIGFTVAA